MVMPPLDDLRDLWESWNECGRAYEAGPLPWAEVEAFARLRGMQSEDAITLRKMSEAYLEGRALTSRLSISPMEM